MQCQTADSPTTLSPGWIPTDFIAAASCATSEYSCANVRCRTSDEPSSVASTNFNSCRIDQQAFPFSALTLLVGRQEGHLTWWWHFDWSFARLIAPVVTTTSITLSSNRIQNGNIVVQTASWMGDNFAIKLSSIGQPTCPTQPSVL